MVVVGDINNHNEFFFISFFVRFPEETADAAGAEKGEMQAETKICGKVRSMRPRPPLVVVAGVCAHTMWHVEQFSEAPD